MSIHTHNAPSSLQTNPETIVAPPLMDWAVVAKVIRLDAVRATRVGEFIMDKLATEGDSAGKLLTVDRDNESNVTTFTYSLASLADQLRHEQAAVKSVIFDGISRTKEGIQAQSPAGLIVAMRVAHWKDLEIADPSGEIAFNASWDKLPANHDQYVEAMLEANGHGLPGISH